ncbi:tetratricopeptide repeat protein [Candidatus Neptunochlamydia vexilliferae]|uniref:Protein-PII uridylyltransferase N-terminal domain-containing protein n=1 Tax=Candidatus Neptunichlamydia vexilliferae TaxID=1651774 RepID=A0ABS0B1B9_9BACT|nr:tetratricopeptide repeat protein [Candidatus Neptunochlamydia vexilliferae]MBF5059335.1 hypothetical protein [Candidatus Neptunochlamydia vexilliferae]
MAISNQSNRGRSSDYLLHEVNLEEEITNIPHNKSSFFPLIQKIKVVENPPPFFSHITFPEKLILSEKKPLKTFDGEKLTPQSPLFANLIKFTDYLTQFTKQNPQSPVKTTLEKIAEVYQNYVKEVCQEKGKKRRGKLKGPARLFGYLHGQVTCLELAQKTGRQLSSLNRYNQTVKINTFGASALQKTGKAFIKREYKNPLNPGYEYAIDAFNKLICGLGSSPSLLLKFNNLLILDPFDERSYSHPLRKEFIMEGKEQPSFFTKNPDKKKNYPFAETRLSHPTQVNLAVEGTSFHDFLNESPNLNELDPYHYSATVILALITRPDDGRADNYMITSKKSGGRNIIGIDNDGALVSPIKTISSKQHLVWLRTTLFLLPNMKTPVSPQFANEFLKISPETLLINWLGALKKYNDKYTSMLKQGVFSPRDSKKLSLPMHLPLSELVTLYEAITKVQKTLQDNPKITHKKLFHTLYPLISDAYDVILKKAKEVPLKAQEFLFSQKNPPCFETLLPKVKIPPQNEVEMEPLDKVLEFFLDGVMPKLSAKKQERLLRKIFEVFPKSSSLSLNGIQVSEAKLSNTLIRAESLQTLTIGKSQTLSHHSLIKLMNERPKLHLILRQGSFQASSLKPLIEYAQKHDRTLSYSLGGKCFPLTPNLPHALIEKALIEGDLSLSEVLIAFKASISPAMTQELAQKGPSQALHFLKTHKIPLDALNSRKQNLLHLAAQAGKTTNIEALLQLGLPLNGKDLEGRTPLHLATNQNHLDGVKLLVKKGANPSALTSSKESPLHLAASHGHLSLIQFFLKTAPQSLNQGDNDGKTPLHRAMWGPPKPQVVKTFLAAGADPNAKNAFDYTPLHWAAKHGHFESARLLLGKKGNPQIPNKNGDTPIDIALKWGQDDVFRLFLNPSHKKELSTLHSSSSSSSSSNQDVEGIYYKEFEKAYDKKDVTNQILYLEKMAATALAKEDFIKSAHLLNAALAIVPANNRPYQNYLFTKLETLEGLFLQRTFKVKTPSSHRNYIETFREKLSQIRGEVRKQLKENIPIDKVQSFLTDRYQKLLCDLFESSIKLLGAKIPIKFTLVGLGSMARQEMCPYSDVEFAILVERNTPEITRYFKNLSRFVALRIINLGETKWEILRPKRLPDGSMREAISLSPGGFSMDIGGLSPLGKEGVYELIGTPKELSTYQSPEWLEKHDGEMILVNAMTQTSLVWGDPKLLKSYQTRTQKWLDTKEGNLFQKLRSKRLRETRALQLLQGHVHEFKPQLTDSRIDLRAFDVKKDFYRPIQMAVGGLLLYAGTNGYGTLKGIKELQKRRWLSEEGTRHLEKLAKAVLTLRVESHLFYQKEQEIIYISKGREDKESKDLLLLENSSANPKKFYQTLIPLHKAIKAFVEGNPKVLKLSKLNDPSIGAGLVKGERNFASSSAEASSTQAVALDPDNIDALSNLQRVKMTRDQAQEALKRNQRLLTLLREKHNDAPHLDLAKVAYHTGHCYTELDQPEQAIRWFNQAIVILFQAKEFAAPILPHIKLGLALAHMKLSNFEASYKHFMEGLKMKKQLLGNKPHVSIAISLNSLGIIYKNQGKLDKAQECYEKALETYEEAQGSQDSLDFATILSNLGDIYILTNKGEKALPLLHRSLKIKEKVLGTSPSPTLVNGLNNLARAYGLLGNSQQAGEYMEKGLKMSKMLPGESANSQTSLSLHNMGGFWFDKGDYNQALSYYRKSLEMKRELFKGHPHLEMAQTLSEMGLTCRKAEKLDEALKYGLEAVDIHRKLVSGDPTTSHGISLGNVGFTYKKMGEIEKAIPYIEEALQIFTKNLGENHGHTLLAKEQLEILKKDQKP